MSNQPATTVLPARDLKAGHMLVAPDGTLTEVTTDARPYAGGTRVRFGLVNGERVRWAGLLPAEQRVTVLAA